MINRAIAFVSALLSSFIVITIIESAEHWLFPIPENSELGDVAHVEQYSIMLPVYALLIMLLAYIFGSFTGGVIIKTIIKQNNPFDAVRLGAVLMFLGLFNLLTYEYPWWFWIVSLVSYIPASYIGYRVVKKEFISSI